MSDEPTGRFPPPNFTSLPGPTSALIRFLDALAGFFIFSGLLIWIWSADWRWAATGFVLAAVVWTISTRADLSRVRK